MTSQHFSGLRVGDVDRDEVRRLLNEHLAAGRLTPEEFGERASHSEQSRTRGELMSLFADLPAPIPDFEGVVPLPEQLPVAENPAQRHGGGTSVPAQRSGGEAMPKYVKHLAVATVAPCALVGLATGLMVSLAAPLVLVLAVLTVGALFLGLSVMDHVIGRWRADARGGR